MLVGDINFEHPVNSRFDEFVEGGESTLLDLFYVAEVFRKSSPKEFHTLTQVPTAFQKIHYER
jgi:gamma-butyrobetaine dioxygenase